MQSMYTFLNYKLYYINDKEHQNFKDGETAPKHQVLPTTGGFAFFAAAMCEMTFLPC